MGVTRQTKQVKTLLDIFNTENNAISVADLVKKLSGQMNKTTVYRILDRLMEDGIVHSFIGKNGLKWYARCQGCSCDAHFDVHPHFQCKVCGEVSCLTSSFKIPEVKGYKVDAVNLLLVGTCSDCL